MRICSLDNRLLLSKSFDDAHVHGGIMLVQAILDETERANLLGDVTALFFVAIVLWYLMPKKAQRH